MYLKQIYSEIYNEPFNYFDLDKRSKLKNAVYLLEVMGLNIGGGVEFALSEKLSLKAEYNYKTQYNGWSLLKFGVVIPF